MTQLQAGTQQRAGGGQRRPSIKPPTFDYTRVLRRRKICDPDYRIRLRLTETSSPELLMKELKVHPRIFWAACRCYFHTKLTLRKESSAGPPLVVSFIIIYTDMLIYCLVLKKTSRRHQTWSRSHSTELRQEAAAQRAVDHHAHHNIQRAEPRRLHTRW